MKKIAMVILSVVFVTVSHAAPQAVCVSADQRIKIITTSDALAYEKLDNSNSQIFIDGERAMFQGSPTLADHLAHTAIYTFHVVAGKMIITDVNEPLVIDDVVLCRDYSYGN